MKKFFKNNLKTILTVGATAVICISGSVFATLQYQANSVSYTTAKNSNIKNVEEALNDLYSKNRDTNVYLYNTGTINENLIGSFVTEAFNCDGGNSSNEGTPTKPNLTFNEKNIEASLTGYVLVGEIFSSKMIDVTNYKYLKIHVNNANIYHNGAAYQWNGIFLSKTNGNNFSYTDNTFDDYFNYTRAQFITTQNTVNSSNVYLKDSIVTMDITNLRGSYYFGIYLRSNSNLTFDKIWLE